MPKSKTMAPIPAPANAPPKWRQDEMFRLEEYPSPVGTSTYQPTKTPADLTPHEVKAIRRYAKEKQDKGAVARTYGLSSKACSDVMTLRARAEVPSDFETPGHRASRESKHHANLVREAKAATDAAEKKLAASYAAKRAQEGG